MALVFLRTAAAFKQLMSYHLLYTTRTLSSRVTRAIQHDINPPQPSSVINEEVVSPCYESSLHLSPLFSSSETQVKNHKIELVDDDTWRVSQGLASSWKGITPGMETKGSTTRMVDEGVNYVPPNKEDPDIDEIEDMRIRGNLFYKLDRGSKEFEEYNFDLHRRKSAKSKGGQAEGKKKEGPRSNSASKLEKAPKNRKDTKKEVPGKNVLSRGEWRPETNKSDETDDSCIGKRPRTPTFNLLTAPYHEPFCLDIFISNASVRASIIHRATSKVVVVAHSISKDMKFDLGSTKNSTAACTAVGQVLAQRALADDIHNAVYTPRKGDKLEGKLQLVLQAIMKNGVNAKVKIKQRNFRKAHQPPAA